ncbi:MAG: GNAT family N-acetyltransferase [Pseudomonadota bacterium]
MDTDGGLDRLAAPAASKRLRYSALNPANVGRLLPILSDPKVAGSTFDLPVIYTLADAQAWCASDPGDWRFIVERRDNGAAVGMVGAYLTSCEPGARTLEVGFLIAPAQWGRGFATEALESLLARCKASIPGVRVTSSAFSDNPASARVLSKCHFARRGVRSIWSRERNTTYAVLLFDQQTAPEPAPRPKP